MGINDAREQLEVCKDEYGKLERENAALRATLTEADQLRDEVFVPASQLRGALAQVAELQAVIEQVRVEVNACRAMVDENLVTPDVSAALGLVVRGLDPILSTSGAGALQTAKAAVWDECLEAIEKHELNTRQARLANPYRTEAQ